jgi:hypothetical protein
MKILIVKFLQPPIITSFFGANINLSTLSSDTFAPFPFFHTWESNETNKKKSVVCGYNLAPLSLGYLNTGEPGPRDWGLVTRLTTLLYIYIFI